MSLAHAVAAALLMVLGLPHPAEATQLAVITTTRDLQSLTEAVAGDTAQVTSLVPPGADAEEYEPRPGDLLRLRGASMLVRVGLGYDEWLDRLIAQHGNPSLARGGERQVDASVGIPLLEVQGRSVELQSGGHAHGLANPHYWLDPANAEIITSNIAAGLAHLAPEKAAVFAANRERFLGVLATRLAGWQQQLAPYAGMAVVAYHNGWPYFARRFRLNITAVIEPKEGVPPGPARLARIAATMRDTGAHIVLIEPQTPREPAETLAATTGARVAVLAGSVGGLPGANDYLSLFEADVNALLQALQQNEP